MHSSRNVLSRPAGAHTDPQPHCSGTRALVMEALAEDFDSEAARAKEQNGRPFRLGVVRPDCDPAIQEGVDSALRASSLPMTEVVLPGMEQAFDAGLTIINVETAAAFGHLVRSGLLQSDVHARLCAAKATQLD